ncbi:hypothetical protein P7D95_09395 [Enterococcus avium]|uniref:hypothetical protein n=1 Tax=Enterococcus avium TaxID=33945 RepID=UPI00288CD3E9|nr:hypothetical protein [Enterococcus avium]MDT2501017.1 hypothetical protein [Enterococcus avium]
MRMVASKQKTLHNLNVFIYAYTVAREQEGLPAKPILNNVGRLVRDKPEPLEKALTPQIEAIENHFRNKYLELDKLFWQGMDAIAASDQETTLFRQRVFIIKRFYGLNATQISKQVGKWGKVITEEVEAAQIAFCHSLSILE